MKADNISCPQCGNEIEISDALTTQLGEKLRKEYESQHQSKLQELAKRDGDLRTLEASLAEQKQQVEQEVINRLEREREKLRHQEELRAKNSVAIEIKDREQQLSEMRIKLESTQKNELDLRKKTRELEEAKQDFDLTLARCLDEERQRIRETAKNEVVAERSLKDAEKDKLIGDLKRQIDELKRKSEQGSQQLQGEVFEIALEELIQRHFPFDEMHPVPKGVHGGDVIQTIIDPLGGKCGSILWESKRTKNWSDAWLVKLRDDQRAAKAQIAILVSTELPKDINHFKHVDGVWISSANCAISLATALRIGLLEIAIAKRSLEGRNDKMEYLYNYLSGAEFRHRVEGIVEAFVTLREDLEAEKRSTQRAWAKREKQLERAVTQTAGMYGDLSGIIGASLPVIEHLTSANLLAPVAEDE